MSKELDFIKQNPMGFLATVDEEGRPRVRAFGIMIDEEGRLLCGTSNKRNAFSQLKAYPQAEFLTMSKNSSTLRISGSASFVEDSKIKASIVERTPFLKQNYSQRMDELEIFYLDEVQYNWFELKYDL